MSHKVIAIIPARGGSKGVLRKNIKLLGDKPLIVYTIETAIKSDIFDKILVSTDDEEIAVISKKHGAEVIKRPKELARDDSHRREAIKHVITTLKEENDFIPDIIIFLQPTSPLRTPKDIKNAYDLFLNYDCDSVVSVCESKENVYWSLTVKKKYIEPIFGWDYFLNKRRQDLPNAFFLNGAIYITTTDNFFKNNSLLSKRTLYYEMPTERSIDIDNEVDFILAEFYLKRNNGRI